MALIRGLWHCVLILLVANAAIATKKPNILFILTDDQDWHMNSLQYMPFLQRYLVQEGTLYSNHFCTVAICCPSRVNLWTGRAAHNTNVTDVFPPFGGYPKVVREGINENYLPVWLQGAGYNTYYTGKLWNAHEVTNYNAPYAGGFNASDFLLDPYTYEYYNAWMTRNGAPPVSYKDQYSPDVVAEKAYGFLEEATAHEDRPWFLTVAPVAPHGNVKFDIEKGEFESDGPKYAPRHAHLFKDYIIPREANFNPEKQGGVAWVKDLPRLNDTVIAYNDEYQRARLRALQSVDEMIEKLVKTLEGKGILDDTYIFFTTDNGYHISQHRMHPGKECGFDTDIHIPLIVRGPGIAAGRVTQAVTSHTDLSPTILKIAGHTREDFDGVPIPLIEEETNVRSQALKARHEHVNIEFWGMAIPEGIYGYYGDGTNGELSKLSDEYAMSKAFKLHAAPNNTYKGLRLIGDDYSIYYSVWCTNETEYYDVNLDPGQLENYFDSSASSTRETYRLFGRSFKHIVDRLDAVMMVLKSCKGIECVQPWGVLHPHGDIKTLKDALASEFDIFYEEQPKVSFERCELGYLKDVEGPQIPNIWSEKEHSELKRQTPGGYGGRGHWSLFT